MKVKLVSNYKVFNFRSSTSSIITLLCSWFYFEMLLFKIIKRLFSFRVRVLLFLLCCLLFIIIYHYLSISSAKIIYLEEIPLNLVPAYYNTNFEEVTEGKQRCAILPTLINGSWPLISSNITEYYLENLVKRTNIKSGGSWKPDKCISQHHVAIVVPYRDRQFQLNLFLAHMHPFLQFQNLHYQIFVVEQTHQRPFNRAKLFNVGFEESKKVSMFPCYIFHDVDLLPLNVLNVYGCTKLPRHLSANIDIFNYKVPYDWIFGGAVSILKDQFINVNGFSNKFFGWGGEDDDFFNRVTRNGTPICRFEPDISRYIMLSHKKEVPNEDRYYYLTTGDRRFESDGLNSLRYTVKKFELKLLYTRIVVDI